MAYLADFRSRIAPHVLTCPTAVMDTAILDACIEFCEKSNIDRRTLDQVTLSSGTQSVDLIPPAYTKVVQVQRVWVNSTELVPLQEDDSDIWGFTSTVQGQTISTGLPTTFVESTPGSIVLSPATDAATTYVLTVRASLKPTRSATTVNDILLENWVDGIAAGALARLFVISKSPWFDAAGAVVQNTLFKQAIGNAILESRRGRNRAEDQVTPVWI